MADLAQSPLRKGARTAKTDVWGVVLDFDGVIVQSMELHAEAYRLTLERLGVAFSDQAVLRREGARSETVIAELLAERGQSVDAAGLRRLAEEKQRIYEGLGPPVPYEGAEALVRGVRDAAGRLGLVTGTRRENLDRLIPSWLPLFDAILAQDAYTQDKPHPEPYLKSARALGVNPKRCAALENAIRGVQSARAAAYGFVVGITTTMGREDLLAAGADRVVATHADAALVLREWLDRRRDPNREAH